MRLLVYAVATSLIVSLLVVGGVFAVRPKEAAPPKISLPHPLILEMGDSRKHISDYVFHLHQELINSAWAGDIKGAQKCLDAGADINVMANDTHWLTPVARAGESGEVEMTRFLLAHGANPNGVNPRSTPIYWTILRNDSEKGVECVRLLLQHGADLWHEDPLWGRPIDAAAGEGNVSMVKLFIEWMPKLSANDRRECLQSAKDIALGNASEQGTLSVVQQLVADGADVNSVSGVGDTPLINAVVRDSLPMVNFLLAHGARVNLRNEDGQTALMFAALPEMTVLLRHGAKVGLRDDTGQTVLMFAAQRSAQETAMLLAHGEQLNARSQDGSTALHMASKAREPKSLEFLLRHGAEVNAQDKQGVTPLMWASVNPSEPNSAKQHSERIECLKILRRFGANSRLKDKQGQSASDYSHLEDYDMMTAS